MNARRILSIVYLIARDVNTSAVRQSSRQGIIWNWHWEMIVRCWRARALLIILSVTWRQLIRTSDDWKSCPHRFWYGRVRKSKRKEETLFSSSSTQNKDERILKSMLSCCAQWTGKILRFKKGETMESMIRRFTTEIWKLKIILVPFLPIPSQCSTSTRVSSPSSFVWGVRWKRANIGHQFFFRSILLLHLIGFTYFKYPPTRILPQRSRESQWDQFDEQKSVPVLVWRLLDHLTQGYAELISSLLESVQHKYLVWSQWNTNQILADDLINCHFDRELLCSKVCLICDSGKIVFSLSPFFPFSGSTDVRRTLNRCDKRDWFHLGMHQDHQLFIWIDASKQKESKEFPSFWNDHQTAWCDVTSTVLESSEQIDFSIEEKYQTKDQKESTTLFDRLISVKSNKMRVFLWAIRWTEEMFVTLLRFRRKEGSTRNGNQCWDRSKWSA